MEMTKILKGAAAALVLSFGFANAGQAAVLTFNTTGFTNMADDVLSSSSDQVLFAVTGADMGAMLAEFDFRNDTSFTAGQFVKISVNANPVVSVQNLRFTLNEGTASEQIIQVTSDSNPAIINATSFFATLLEGYNTLKVTGTGLLANASGFNASILATPIPAAGLLFGSVLLAGGLYRRRKMVKEIGLPA